VPGPAGLIAATEPSGTNEGADSCPTHKHISLVILRCRRVADIARYSGAVMAADINGLMSNGSRNVPASSPTSMASPALANPAPSNPPSSAWVEEIGPVCGLGRPGQPRRAVYGESGEAASATHG